MHNFPHPHPSNAAVLTVLLLQSIIMQSDTIPASFLHLFLSTFSQSCKFMYVPVSILICPSFFLPTSSLTFNRIFEWGVKGVQAYGMFTRDHVKWGRAWEASRLQTKMLLKCLHVDCITIYTRVVIVNKQNYGCY